MDATFEFWEQIPRVVKRAPMFPLDTFADRLTRYLEMFGSNARLRALAAQVDRLLAKRTGPFAAAEKCRDRAVALYSRGDLVQAVQELHRAKIDWSAAETLRGAILSAGLISGIYHSLNLPQASKYYALAEASLALNNSDDDLKRLAATALLEVVS